MCMCVCLCVGKMCDFMCVRWKISVFEKSKQLGGPLSSMGLDRNLLTVVQEVQISLIRRHLNNVAFLLGSQSCVEDNEAKNILHILTSTIKSEIVGRGREEGRVQMSPLVLGSK